MWFFPFQSYNLKTNLNRFALERLLLDITYLSDENYKKTKNAKQYFYGSVSKEDFSLETIADEHRLVSYVSGTFKGADEDMFVVLHLKAFSFRRIYVVLLLFLILCLGFLVSQLWQYGPLVFKEPTSIIFIAMTIALFGYLFIKCLRFWKIVSNSLSFFKGLFQADLVSKNDIPVVFRL